MTFFYSPNTTTLIITQEQEQQHSLTCVKKTTTRTVSTCVRGLYGIEEDVFLSMPCSLGAHGVRRVVNPPMTPEEIAEFQNAAKTIWNVQKGIW